MEAPVCYGAAVAVEPPRSAAVDAAATASTAGSADAAACVAAADILEAAAKEGWLQKRYPARLGKWEWRWCVLCSATLTYYADRACGNKKGTICIKPDTRFLQFMDEAAPGDAELYRENRPFGFVLDVDMWNGARQLRRLFYFDAGNEDMLKTWAQAVALAIGHSATLSAAGVEPPAIQLQAARKEQSCRALWEEICGMEAPQEDNTLVVEFQRWRFNHVLQASTSLTVAIRAGVSPFLYGNLWHTCVARNAQQIEVDNSYAHFVSAGSALGETETLRVIEADIPRTGIKGIDSSALRRILFAFAAANPVIGYCQSMNFIAATLLLHMDEERAFASFKCLLEELLPAEYYTPGMLGLRADLKVLESLIEHYLPDLHARLNAFSLDLAPITMNWFLCVFLNTLPASLSHHIFTCLLHEGPEVLFRTALAILRSQQQGLLEAESLPDAYVLLREPIEPGEADSATSAEAQELLEVMYSDWLADLDARRLDELRQGHVMALRLEDTEIAERRQRLLAARQGCPTHAAGAIAEPSLETPAERLRRRSRQLSGDSAGEPVISSFWSTFSFWQTSPDAEPSDDSGTLKSNEDRANNTELFGKTNAAED